MDGQRHRLSKRKENEHDVNYSAGRNRPRAKNCRHKRHEKTQRHVPDSKVQSREQASSSSIDKKEIPGFIYDPAKKRYFKENQGQPKEQKHFIIQNDRKCEDTTRQSKYHILSRLQYLQNRKTNILYNNMQLKRLGVEDWARNMVERKSFVLSNNEHPYPGSLSSFSLSKHSGKLVAIAKLYLGSNLIHIYDINDDKTSFIKPHMVSSIISSQVTLTHVEWNPNENMKNFFLLNVFGSEKSDGSAVVCKFDESSLTCELNGHRLPNGTSWHCSWSNNPQFSNLLGIAGSKQAVLVDWVNESLVSEIRSSSDGFCIEFSPKNAIAYVGCRNGNIMCVDIRMANSKQSKSFNVSDQIRSSATSIKVMQDENYLMASSIDGMIKMWDVRLSKPVKEYAGNMNETQLIPFVMDSSENIMASSGHDGNIRMWSVQTGELLNTIDATNSRYIPPLCLSENWALRNNMMALGIGVEDELKLYF